MDQFLPRGSHPIRAGSFTQGRVQAPPAAHRRITSPASLKRTAGCEIFHRCKSIPKWGNLISVFKMNDERQLQEIKRIKKVCIGQALLLVSYRLYTNRYTYYHLIIINKHSSGWPPFRLLGFYLFHLSNVYETDSSFSLLFSTVYLCIQAIVQLYRLLFRLVLMTRWTIKKTSISMTVCLRKGTKFDSLYMPFLLATGRMKGGFHGNHVFSKSSRQHGAGIM